MREEIEDKIKEVCVRKCGAGIEGLGGEVPHASISGETESISC